MIQDLTPDLARALRVDEARGAVVSRVEPGTPAEDAGLRAGDIILTVDGIAVDGSGDLRNRIGFMRPGAKVELEILRDGKRKRLKAKLEAATGQRMAKRGDVSRALAGADFEALEPGVPGYGEVDGVAVTSIQPGSRAARTGLRVGDVVTAVNNRPVRSVGELFDAFEIDERVFALNVYRNGAELFIVVPSA
jgi:S1-C subfamily serine protease